MELRFQNYDLQFAGHSSIVNKKSGSSSVGRAIAFQAIGREFEPRLPLKRVHR